jgi:branched-chain amino acid transport system substrate-binding protein
VGLLAARGDRRPAEDKGETPDALAALAYDSAKLLFQAMESAKSMSGKDLAAALAAIRKFEGATGTIAIDAKRDASKPCVVIQIKDGKLVPVATFPPRAE